MSHLKVELRSLRRSSLPRGYAFDLTRYCSVCWTKLGRVTNRGRSCPSCKRKVCKICRCWIQGTKWICFACKGLKSNSATKGYRGWSSGEETGSYTSRETDWGSSESKDLRSYAENVKLKSSKLPMSKTLCAEDVEINDANPQAHSSSKMQCTKGKNEGSHVFQSEKRIISQVKVDNESLFPIDLELDFVDPVQRWLLNCYSCEISKADDDDADYETEGQAKTGLSNKKRLCNIRKRIPLEADVSEESRNGKKEWHSGPHDNIDGSTFKNGSMLASELIEVQGEERNTITKSCGIHNGRNSSAIFSRTPISETDPWTFIRNAPGKTISVRERPRKPLIPSSSEYFNSRLSYRNFHRWNSFGFGYCRRSRSTLLKTTNDYFDLLKSDFVECRVKRLEEDLANAENQRYAFYDDFDVQSVLSLDLDWAITDKDDYRLVYLSSSAASEDSYMDSGNSEIHRRIHRSNESLLATGTENIDWNFSLTSSSKDTTDDFDEEEEEESLNEYEMTVPKLLPVGETKNGYPLESSDSDIIIVYPLKKDVLNTYIEKPVLNYFDETSKFEKRVQSSSFHTITNFKSLHIKTIITENNATALTFKIMEGMFSFQNYPNSITEPTRSICNNTLPSILYQKEQQQSVTDSVSLHNLITKPRDIHFNSNARESSDLRNKHLKNVSKNYSSMSTVERRKLTHQTEQNDITSKRNPDCQICKFSFPIFVGLSRNTFSMDTIDASTEQKNGRFLLITESAANFLDLNVDSCHASKRNSKDEMGEKCVTSDVTITHFSEKEQRLIRLKNMGQCINLNMKPYTLFMGQILPSTNVIPLTWTPRTFQTPFVDINYNNRLPHFEERFACSNGQVGIYQLHGTISFLEMVVPDLYNIFPNYNVSSLDQENATRPISRTNCISEAVRKPMLVLRCFTLKEVRETLEFLCYLIGESNTRSASLFQKREINSRFQEFSLFDIMNLNKTEEQFRHQISIGRYNKNENSNMNNTKQANLLIKNTNVAVYEYANAVEQFPLKTFLGLMNQLQQLQYGLTIDSNDLNVLFKFSNLECRNEQLHIIQENLNANSFQKTKRMREIAHKLNFDFSSMQKLLESEMESSYHIIENLHLSSDICLNFAKAIYGLYLAIKSIKDVDCRNENFELNNVHNFTEKQILGSTTTETDFVFMNGNQFSIDGKERSGFLRKEKTAKGSFQVGEYLRDVTSDPTLTMTSQEYSSASPENGVIDTPPTTTAKTGLSAFAVTVYRKHRLPPSPLRGQQLQVVPAVQLQCSIGRVAFYDGCRGSCPQNTARRLPYVKINTKDIEELSCLLSKELDSICSVLVSENFVDNVERNNSGSIAVDNSVSASRQLCLRLRPVVLGTGVVDTNKPDGLLLNSQEISMSFNDMDSSKVRGSKIAELKKFFDGGADESNHLRCGRQNTDFNSVSDKTKSNALTRVKSVDTSCTALSSHMLSNQSYLSRFVSHNSTPKGAEDRLLQIDAKNCSDNGAKLHTIEQPTNNRKNRVNGSYNSTNGIGLWKNVETDLDCENTLWDTKQLNSDCSDLKKHSGKESPDYDKNIQNGTHSFTKSEIHSSTSELNTLIAASRAELLRKEPDVVPEKSTLEDYFVYGFENNTSPYKISSNHMYSLNGQFEGSDIQNSDLAYSLMEDSDGHHIPQNDASNYECDMDEMMFDDLEDIAFSDTSDEEDLRYRPSPPSNNHMQSFSLHTIIEESCEESEHDSNSATPTNRNSASKLEKYFSWDIVNNTHGEVQHREIDDNSTIYSDSLSEASNSSNDNRDFEPTDLSSSRLETYFTTGLVGNHQYHYPDDAEFLDDVSEQCSDFDEDEKCSKISRSALLSSLEVSSAPSYTETFNRNCKFDLSECDTSKLNFNNPEDENQDDKNSTNLSSDTKSSNSDEENIECHLEDRNVSNFAESQSTFTCVKRNLYTVCENSTDESEDSEAIVSNSDSENKVPALNNKNENTSESTTENLDTDFSTVHEEINSKKSNNFVINQIISQLIEISENSDPQSQANCNFAWQLLENEIEQMMKQIPPVTSTSCNSSTFGSSNSDYGSDTVDSGECLTTDEDENCVESKTKKESNKCKKEKFNEREHLEFWKKILQTLNTSDPQQSLYSDSNDFNHTQSYIRDHIVAFMSSLNANPQEKLPNDNAKSCDTLSNNPSGENHESSTNFITNTIVVDEGISIDSTENLYSDCETASSVCATEDNLSKKVEDWYNSNVSALEVNKSTVELMSEPPPFFQNSEMPDEFQFDPSEPIVNEMVVEVSEVKPNDVEPADMKTDDVDQSLDDSASHFSVYVDIKIGEESNIVTERHQTTEVSSEEPHADETHRPSLHDWVSEEHINLLPNEKPYLMESIDSDEKAVSLPVMNSKSFSEPNLADSDCGSENRSRISEFLENTGVVHRDTGYYSFKSSDDSILGLSDSIDAQSELACPRRNFEESHSNSIRSSVKSNVSSSKVLSNSTTNIPLSSNAELKFNTLQLKPRASKVSMNPRTNKLDCRPVTSYFSPVSVLKKLFPSKMSGSPSSEISYPSKYLKKYGRSASVDDDSIFGATSMPHLNAHNSADSHIGTVDGERENGLLEDELQNRHSHSRYNQSVLSLGAHSASTTSIYSAAGGHHYGYVTVSGDVLFGLNYNQKSQTMEVFVKQCRNLAAIDNRKNKSDPYVKVYLLPDKTKAGKRKTKTKRNTLNPVFNELLRFPVLKNELENRTLWLSVWNSDLFGRNDFLGEITLALGYRLLDSPTLRWYPLQERAESLTSPLAYKGEIYLALKYVPKDLSLEPCFRPAPVIAVRGALHVLVKEARNISVSGGSGTSDAFCKSYLLPDKTKGSKQKTPVVRKSRNPKWYYTMVYENLSIEELKERSLELTVWDHDKITSNDFLGAVRLNTGLGLYHGLPVDWMDAARDETSLWLAMLERPNMWVDGSLPLRPTLQSIRC